MTFPPSIEALIRYKISWFNMADGHHPPLNYEASATTTHPHVSTTLPPEVATCLKNARFVRPLSPSVHLPSKQQLTLKCSAPPRYNLNTCLIQRPTSPCLPNELYLSPVLAISLSPHHNNDHKCSISQNPQPTLEPSRLPPSS
jgi:hypothetical protein